MSEIVSEPLLAGGLPGRPPAALELRHITKRFGDLLADEDVSLSLEPGEVHALVGENGAGKSTLMNICFGLLQPTAGEIYIQGRRVVLASPTAAREHGIGMVHQHFKLVPSLTVAENVFLGAEAVTRSRTLDRARMVRELAAVSERYGLAVDPKARVAGLSAGVRQRVEILKALYFDARVLILDEPTAVLTPQEADRLLAVLRDLAADQRSVLLVTHKLREVMGVADRFSVLRRGKLVATGFPEQSSEHDIATLMVGREVSLHRPTPVSDARVDGATVLRCADLAVTGQHGAPAVDHVTFDLRAGEIIGIAGVEGNGQTELVEALAGLRPRTAGTVTLAGADVTTAGAADLRERGIAHIAEDRLATGVATTSTVQDNLAGGRLRSALFGRGWYHHGLARRWSRELINRYDVRGANPGTPVSSLSGGNMQKVVVARELDTQPTVLLAAQPTRGIDVGASEFIHAQLRDLRDRGAGIFLVSADLTEILALADRVLVMYRGRIVAEFRPDEDLIPRIGLAMAGAPDPRDAVHEVAPAPAAGPGQPRRVSPVTDPGPTTAPRAPWRRSLLGAARRASTAASQPIAAVLAAFLLGMIIVAAIGDDPIAAYRSLIVDTLSDQAGLSSAIAQATPLLLIAVSTFVAFRSGILNLGGEGQLYFGAFASAVVALNLPSGLPGPVLIAVCIAAGGLAGALWGLIPGLLNAYLDVNILVTTLMFSYIAQSITAYFVAGTLRDPSAGVPATKLLPAQASLPAILGQGGATIGIFIGVAALVCTGVLLFRTRWGLAARFVGANREFARYLGVNVSRKVVQVMCVSGFLAGVAGAVATLGTEHRFNQGFSPGYGFIGLTVALLGRLNPAGIALAALLYGALEAGSTLMQLNTGVPLALVNVLEGIVILLTTATVLRLRLSGKGGA
jgi:ABC-type uncharacterized transport system ATPase subunit/ABC-type uncharacterized transport system permease subunit